MSFRAAIIVTMLLTPAAGCRIVDFASPLAEQPISNDVLAALELQLKHDAWQRNPRWSLLNTTVNGRPLHPESTRNRWRFATPIVREFVSQLNAGPQPDGSANRPQDHTGAAPFDDPPWTGWTAQSPFETLDESGVDPHTEGTRYLAALVDTNGLVGWNAAILWAQRDPHSAQKKTASILEKLVTNPPRYDPQTGRYESETPAISRRLGSIRGTKTPAMSTDGLAAESSGRSVKMELLKRLREDAAVQTEKSKAKNSDTETWSSWLKKYVANAEASSRARRISPWMQSAAAEAWCRVLAANAANRRAALFPAGRLLKRIDVPNPVRAELYRGVARWVKPADIPRLENALRKTRFDQKPVPVELRRAAIDACLMFATRRRRDASRNSFFDPAYDANQWPETILNCRYDSDARVRETFGRWTAVAGHPDAIDILERQFLDPASQVRHGSLLSLGITGDDRARQRLRNRAASGTENDRAQAVKGLARWGISELERYAGERSAAIQHAVAVALADYPSARGGRILKRYSETAGEHVQIAGLRSIEHWPYALAAPILLSAMGEGTRHSAEVAYRELKRRELRRGVDFRAAFPSLESRPVRAKAAERLAYRFGLPLEFERNGSAEHSRSESRVGKQYLSEIDRYLAALTGNNGASARRDAIDRLRGIPADDIALIERLVLEARRPHSESLFLDVLPEKSQTYAALKELYDDDPLVQRRAAHALAQNAARRPLSRLAVRRMHSRLRERQDRVLWHSAMRAVMPDTTDESDQLATEAAFHAAPTVRVQACEFFERHPNPRKADILLQLLNDHDRNVRLAAIRAAGFSRSPSLISGRRAPPREIAKPSSPRQSRLPDQRDLLGLKALMISADTSIRHAAIVSLVRLGDDLGYRELTRMSYSTSPEIRKEAFGLMGESRQRRFVDALIQRGWAERNPEVGKIILRSLQEIVPAGERPVGLSAAKRYDAQIELWAKSRDAARSGTPSAQPIRTAHDPRNRANGRTRTRTRTRTGFSTRMAR